MYDFWEVYSLVIYFGVPVAAIVFFIVSLVKFLTTPKENVEKRKTWKVLFIVSSILTGLLVVTILAFIGMMALAMANM